MQNYQENLLFQHRTSSVNDEFVYQCPEFKTAIIKSIVIANVTDAAITYRLFMNPGSTSVGIANSLGYDIAILANATQLWRGFGGITHPTSVGIQSSVANSIVITGYGVLMGTGK